MSTSTSPGVVPTTPDDPVLDGWYHTIELGDGIVSRGHFDHRGVIDLYGIPASLEGKSALDVGTGDGYFAFELERRGADPVVTIDLPTLADADWIPPATGRIPEALLRSQPWGDRFDLAKRMLGSRVHREPLSVYELSPERLGTFDVVFSGDMLLHLINPLQALINIRSVTRELAVIETVREHDLETAHPDQPVMHFGVLAEEEFPGANTTYWKFTTKALEHMLIYAGFARVEAQPGFGLPPFGLPATSVVAYTA